MTWKRCNSKQMAAFPFYTKYWDLWIKMHKRLNKTCSSSLTPGRPSPRPRRLRRNIYSFYTQEHQGRDAALYYFSDDGWPRKQKNFNYSRQSNWNSYLKGMSLKFLLILHPIHNVNFVQLKKILKINYYRCIRMTKVHKIRYFQVL